MSPPVRLPVIDVLRLMRPRTRGDCEAGERPCPWLTCEHHLALERLRRPLRRGISDDAALAIVELMSETCALDAALVGGVDNTIIGDALGITRERVRQIGELGLAELARAGLGADWTRDDLRPGRAASPVDPSDLD